MAILAFALPSYLYSQAATAALRITALDPQGARVPDVEMVLTNTATNQLRKVTTNGEGEASFSQLPPAPYRITVEHPRFLLETPVDLRLRVGDELSVRLPLQVFSQNQTISVSADLTRIQESPASGLVISQEMIENMPLSGRSLQSLFDLTPGVLRSAGIESGQFVVNGQRADANYFMVDGISGNVNTPEIGAPSGIAGQLPSLSSLNTTHTLVSVDALQEFKIQTSSYAPEFGRSPGGQISLVTRSGNNRFTGSLFEYFRNEAMDANDWFSNRAGIAKSPTRQHDFGGVFGGPVVLPKYSGKDRTFFFLSYERLLLKQPQTASAVVPSLAAREAATGVGRQLLNAYPLPTGADIVGANGVPTGTADYVASYSNPSTLNSFSLRGDHIFQRAGTLFARFSNAPSTAESRAQGMAYLRLARRNTITTTLGHTLVLGPTMNNDLRVNITQASGMNRYTMDSFNGAAPLSADVLFPAFADPSNASVTFQVNYGATLPSFGLGTIADNTTRQFNLVDNFLLQVGKHELKFGADYRRLRVNLQTNTSISPNFATMEDLSAGIASTLSITRRDSDLNPVVENLSLYAQDTWRVIDRLTLTYGLRWELNPAPNDGNRQLMTLVGGFSPADIDIAATGSPLFPTRYRNFAPRFGAAYQLRRKAGWETVVRGGLGLYYDLGTSTSLMGYEGFPYRVTTSYSRVPYPLGTAQGINAPVFRSEPPYSTAYGYVPDFVSPKTWQWNLTAEQGIGARQTLSLAYVGAAGRDLVRTEGYLRPNPRFSDSVSLTRNSGSSDYHSMQVQFTRRMSAGLQGMLAYTYAHSIDTGSSSSSIRNISTTFMDPREGRADSDFDVRHNLAAALTYDIPRWHVPGFLGSVFQGFSLDTLVKARTGTPVNPTGRTLSTGYYITLQPDLVPGQPLYLDDPNAPGGRRFNPAAFVLATAGVQGTAPRNMLRGFGASQLDLAVRREFLLGERMRLQFRGEVFNLTNTPSFAAPTTSISSAQFGYATQTLNRSLRGISPLYEIGGPRSAQLALKILF